MAIVNGTGGKDFIHRLGDGRVAPLGATDITGTTTGSDIITAGAGSDTIYAYSGADRIDGGSGADSMYGGRGNDTYLVNVAGDLVVEAVDGGIDTVQASISYTLRAQVENLVLVGASGLQGTGNVLANRITGTIGANTLTGKGGNDTLLGAAGADTIYGGIGNDLIYGGSGADSMIGGSGADTYIVANSTDVIVELAGQGRDRVQSTVSHTLFANVEDLLLLGTIGSRGTGNVLANRITGTSGANVIAGRDGNDTLIGGAGNDTVYGGAGNDKIYGGSGADQMTGGAGNDTYWLENAADVVTEVGGGGIDTVQSTLSYTLGAEVENLVLLGLAEDGTGNGLDNRITGNGLDNELEGAGGADTILGGLGNDSIDGGTGADSLIGGGGNDIYLIDGADVVVEEADAGFDRMESSTVNLVAAANVEALTLGGALGLSVTGNDLANTINGNDGGNDLQGAQGSDTINGGNGNDTIDGGTGADLMFGGQGNDIFIVDSLQDNVQEAAGQGIDQITATAALSEYSIDGKLNVENLTMLFTGGATATGNAGSNVITTASGNDTILAGDGSDVIRAGAGSDVITGGADGSADFFVFDSTAGFDTITDFVSGVDEIVFDMSDLDIGNADTTIDGALTRAASGGWSAANELVVFTTDVAVLSKVEAAAAIGSATAAVAAGSRHVFVVDTGTNTGVYLFTSDGDAVVTTDELTQLAKLSDTASTTTTDYLFLA